MKMVFWDSEDSRKAAAVVATKSPIPEDDEVFWVRLTAAEGGALLRPDASGVALRVRRNDSPLRFSQAALVVPETAGVVALTVTRGRLTEDGPLIGSDDTEVSVDYVVVSGDGPASATPAVDFTDLQPTRTLTFPAFTYEARLLFNVSDDDVPEIAESFHVVLMEGSVRGDAVLVAPAATLVTIEPNDKPHGVLFEGITVVRNGGNYGQVSVNWTISRNSSSQAPVSDDLMPAAGMLVFAAGQTVGVLVLDIDQDELPEEAEAFLLRLLPDTVTGGAEVDEPMEVSGETEKTSRRCFYF
ncbi:hypothetical protein CRUP_038330 [Coryphaenoides rupestris]|nr:hypothetical protein CRUP_038330 [Coryphaenoides rupestris]